MKKIPTLFVRDRSTHLVIPEVTPGCEWVIQGEGIATVKWDGTACLFFKDLMWKRYTLKRGKTAPVQFMYAQEAPDPITGEHPGWVPVVLDDVYHKEALDTYIHEYGSIDDGTYELVGSKVQGNPYGFLYHYLFRHGCPKLKDVPNNYAGLRDKFEKMFGEGIVWHHPDGRMAKLKRRDFNFEWPMKAEE